MKIKNKRFTKGAITVIELPGGNATLRTKHGVFVRALNGDAAEASVERADVPDLIDCLRSYVDSSDTKIAAVDGVVVVEWNEE